MPGERRSRLPDEERSLRALAKRFRGRFPPSTAEVQAALERAATALMTLEARLQKVQRRLAEAPSEEIDGERQELVNQISSLRDAFKELRSSAEAVGSPLAQGFVLPRDP
jgi:chromosome segregation ATPase